ncbi:hypothetical protein LOAG_07383 [Loa loa]|uniref:Uncharacterized protein n=1 Tax=Loa loa TaxID=7209 RepID=A0A1S0TXK8_LOALO|nr:hypothetical protein LOAG_07383 [Loa loa]EFO21102.2 hypothetical protein LOAG_07383 [Loa loa]
MPEVRLTPCRPSCDFAVGFTALRIAVFSVMFIVYSLGTMVTSSILSKTKRE